MGFLMMLLRYFSFTTLPIIFCGFFVFAQTGAETAPQPTATTAPPKQAKKQTISFEDELVEGTMQKPELFYMFQKKNFNYKRLIRLRENFIPEMRRSSEDIKRLRGGH